MNDISSNIIKLYIFKALRWSMLLLPVIVLYFQDKWLDMTQVFLLQSIFAAWVVLFEIPTWYLGDMFRRKDWLIIWSVCALVWRTLYHFATWFWTLAFAELVMAFAFTFRSGSDSALLYDTLLELKQEDNFKKIKGRYLAAWNFAEWFWALLGWWLATFWFWIVTMSQIVLAALWLLISFFFVEPSREKYDVQHTGLRHLIDIITNVFKSKDIVWSILVYSAITWLSTMIWVWIAQPYFEYLKLPIVWFWVLRAVWNISVWVFSLMSHKIEQLFSERKLLVWMPILVLISYILLWAFPSILILRLMFSFYASRGILSVVYQDIINRNVSSKDRATILSIKSLLFRFVFMIFWPLIGWTIDTYGILSWFYVSPVIILLLILCWRYMLHLHWSFSLLK